MKTLVRQIDAQFQGKRQIPFAATHHEIGHGREITWAMRAKEAPEHIKAAWPGTAWMDELVACGTIEGKPFKARHLFLTSLRTTPDALLRLIRQRWSIESWHWIRDTQFHEDRHRYRGNGAGVLATLRTAALNLLRLTGFDSIRDGLHAVMHDIRALLAMAMRQPREKPGCHFESALQVQGGQGISGFTLLRADPSRSAGRCSSISCSASPCRSLAGALFVRKSATRGTNSGTWLKVQF